MFARYCVWSEAIFEAICRRWSQINAQLALKQAQIQLKASPRVTGRCLWRSMSGITPLWTPSLGVNQSVEDPPHLELSAEKRRDCITFPSECWERALSEKRPCTDALRWAAAHITSCYSHYILISAAAINNISLRHCPLSEDRRSALIGGLGAPATPLIMRGLNVSSPSSSLRIGQSWWLNQIKPQGPVVQKV